MKSIIFHNLLWDVLIQSLLSSLSPITLILTGKPKILAKILLPDMKGVTPFMNKHIDIALFNFAL
jgi:hypothetical protein